MKATRNVPSGTDPDNPPSIDDLISEYRAAHDAFDEADQATVDRYHAALHAARNARPIDRYELATQLQWLATEQGDLFQPPLGAILSHVADRLERGAMPRRYTGIEEATRAICAGYALLEQYETELAPSSVTLTAEEVDRHGTRLGWLIDSLGPDVRKLAVAVWGHAAIVDDIYPCQDPESGEGRS